MAPSSHRRQFARVSGDAIAELGPHDPVARIERQEVIEALGQLPVGVDQAVGVDL
jgi:hypothetical protein